MGQGVDMKTYLMTGAMFLACAVMTLPAHAQIVVRDNDVEEAVKEADENIVKAINAEGKARTEFETEKTEVYYEDAIERLNEVINTLSIVDGEMRNNQVFTNLDAQDDARTAVLGVSEGNGAKFGLSNLPDGGNENVNAYLARYGYLKPEELYPESPALRNQLIDEHKALYYADALVGEVDDARQARYDAYEQLSQEASQTQDVHKALDVNNALLIENGRNLALLIHLQSAQLSSQSAQLRSATREREAVSNIFGLRGDGPDT